VKRQVIKVTVPYDDQISTVFRWLAVSFLPSLKILLFLSADVTRVDWVLPFASSGLRLTPRWSGLPNFLLASCVFCCGAHFDLICVVIRRSNLAE
jgi:hypothetical protein